jgi:hypothetical protein
MKIRAEGGRTRDVPPQTPLRGHEEEPECSA